MSRLLRTENLTKNFGGIVAVDDFSIDIGGDKITGFIGPNGAGKTTFFNLVTGVLKSTSGDIIFDGEPITDLSPNEICKRGIGRTFQTPQPFHHLTVEENLQIAEHFGQSESSEFDIDELLELFDLADRRDDHPDSLQLIEQKYLDFARTLATNPRLILLDEILAGLNPTEKDDFTSFIGELHDTHGFAFIIVEHDLKVIRTISDEIVVINKGRLLSRGSADEVLNDPEVQEAYVE